MIEPGLLLRVGPTSDQNSVLEFVMDPHHDRGDRYLTEDPSTGKLSFSNHQSISRTITAFFLNVIFIACHVN